MNSLYSVSSLSLDPTFVTSLFNIVVGAGIKMSEYACRRGCVYLCDKEIAAGVEASFLYLKYLKYPQEL